MRKITTKSLFLLCRLALAMAIPTAFAAPTVESVTNLSLPESPGIGESAEVRLSGSGFSRMDGLRLGGMDFSEVSVESDHRLTAKAPARLPRIVKGIWFARIEGKWEDTGTPGLAGSDYGPPVPLLSSDAVLFGTVPVLTTTSRTLTLRNGSGLPLMVESLEISGKDALRFSLSDIDDCLKLFRNRLAVYSPEDACSFSVSFRPDGRGKRTANLEIVARDGTRTFPVEGVGGQAVWGPQVPAEGLALSSPPGRPASGVVHFRNIGNLRGGLNGLSLGDGSGFALAKNDCVRVKPGATCRVSVSYRPDSLAVREASTTLSFVRENPARKLERQAVPLSWSVQPKQP